jgi:hypothetical protein
VIRKLLLPLAVLVPLCLVLSAASCGPTCPGLQACGTTNAGGGDAGSSSSDPTTCDQLTALQTCMTAFCKTTDNPFCSCYEKGFDLGPSPGCACVDFDAAEYCKEAAANGVDAANLDCSAATSAVATQCVNVQ